MFDNNGDISPYLDLQKATTVKRVDAAAVWQNYWVKGDAPDKLAQAAMTKIVSALRVLEASDHVVVERGAMGDSAKYHEKHLWGVLTGKTYRENFSNG